MMRPLAPSSSPRRWSLLPKESLRCPLRIRLATPRHRAAPSPVSQTSEKAAARQSRWPSSPRRGRSAARRGHRRSRCATWRPLRRPLTSQAPLLPRSLNSPHRRTRWRRRPLWCRSTTACSMSNRRPLRRPRPHCCCRPRVRTPTRSRSPPAGLCSSIVALLSILRARPMLSTR